MAKSHAFEFQAAAALRSEEYRQLFRLPAEEVSVFSLTRLLAVSNSLFVFFSFCFDIFWLVNARIVSHD